MKKELSIVFPTLNEAENLKYLIPEFESMLKNINITKMILIYKNSNVSFFR